MSSYSAFLQDMPQVQHRNSHVNLQVEYEVSAESPAQTGKSQADLLLRWTQQGELTFQISGPRAGFQMCFALNPTVTNSAQPQNRQKCCPDSRISILRDIQTEQQKTTGDLSCLNTGLALCRGLGEVALKGPFQSNWFYDSREISMITNYTQGQLTATPSSKKLSSHKNLY